MPAEVTPSAQARGSILRLGWLWSRMPGPEVALTISNHRLVGSIASRVKGEHSARAPVNVPPLEITNLGPPHLVEILSWLGRLQPLRRLRLRADDGLPGWLVEPVTTMFDAQLPTHVTVADRELAASWNIAFEAFDDHHTARANIKRASIYRTVRVAATPAGHAALLDWLSQVNPVAGRMTLSDDGEGDDLQRDLAMAGYFPERRHASRGPLPETEGAWFGEVKAQLTLRGLGWLDLILRLGDEQLRIPGSWMASPWGDTLEALTALLGGALSADPVWVTDEPDFYQMHLRRLDKGHVGLRVTATHSDSCPPEVDDIEHLAIERVIDLRDLAGAFLSATQALLQATPPADLQTRWPSRNPGRAIDALERALAAPVSSVGDAR